MKTTSEQDQRRRDAARDPAAEHTADVALGVPGHHLRRLHQTIGNRAVQRLIARQPQGRAPASALARGRDGLNLVQRDEDEAPGEADTGTVTIQPPASAPYEVSGTTLAEVHAQLDPEEWGRCRYHYGYEYDYDPRSGRTTRVDITLTMTIRLPHWGEGYDQATPEARAEWQRMLGALRAHENRHAEIAREWAPTFKERMLGIRVANVVTRYNEVKGQADGAQRDYDTSTSHGETEGVSLDLSIDAEETEPEAEGETE